MADDVVERLLPCPVCGSATLLHENDWCEPSEWCVVCTGTGCGITLGSDTQKANAIALANRRSPSPDAEAARREAIEEAAKVAQRKRDAEIKLAKEYEHNDAGSALQCLSSALTAAEIAEEVRALSPPVEGE